MNVLVLNVGSSSLKFELIGTDAERIEGNRDDRLAGGSVERIGGEAVISLSARRKPAGRSVAPLRNLAAAVEHVAGWLASEEADVGIASLAEIEAVGHRVVHGGEHFARSQRIDESVLRALDELVELAPLHNPHNIAGIRAASRVFGPGIPQVAVFDTAFHQTIPEIAFLYGLPYQLYRRHKVRRYGFHGTSHRYVAHRFRQLTGRARETSKLITLHLGNGASACAIRDGDSVDTSMGFTPLEGLVMGTRSGDLDAAILDYVANKEGLTLSQVELMLNKQSGLLGLSGLTADMRELLMEVEEHDDRRARLAVEVFCYRARKYLGAYLAVLDGADAIVFAGGIGENAVDVRARICSGLEWLGVSFDATANAALTGGAEGRFSAPDSRVELWVIPTDEELLIARDTWRVVTGAPLRY
ncbi:MAG TPA: acetate kinase [Gemmatimonadaceae bacterium]|nr:acetate kinase [Gemmatimonadaceae bacterium]